MTACLHGHSLEDGNTLAQNIAQNIAQNMRSEESVAQQACDLHMMLSHAHLRCLQVVP
jgi:hypothetical protein